MRSFPLRLSLKLALMTVVTTAALFPTAQAAADEILVPQAGTDGSGNVVVGYNRCPISTTEGLKPCNGPYTLVVIPTGDPCSKVPAAVPGACGHPYPPTDPCAYYNKAAGTCGNPTPSTQPCTHAPTAPVVCKDPCDAPSGAMRNACDAIECVATGWNCPDPCYSPTPTLRPACNAVKCIEGNDYYCPDPCASVPSTVPGLCGRPLPSTDVCDYYSQAPGTCGNPTPSTQPCTYAPTAPVVCKDPCYAPSGTMRTVCDGVECVATGWNCPDPCYNPTSTLRPACNAVKCIEGNDYYCPNPCASTPPAVPYACGHPGPSTDPCAYYNRAPGTCGNPPPPVFVPIADGELCVYKMYLDGSRELVTCVPINR